MPRHANRTSFKKGQPNPWTGRHHTEENKLLVGWGISPSDAPLSTGVLFHPSPTGLGRDKLAALAVSG